MYDDKKVAQKVTFLIFELLFQKVTQLVAELLFHKVT